MNYWTTKLVIVLVLLMMILGLSTDKEYEPTKCFVEVKGEKQFKKLINSNIERECDLLIVEDLVSKSSTMIAPK